MPWIDPDFPKTATVSDLVGRVLGLNPGMMTGPGTNTYLIGRRDPILLDTGAGVPDYLPLFERYMGERGWAQPSRVVLTHRHRDHLGGVEQLRGRYRGLRVAKMIYRDAGLPEDVENLRDGDVIEGDGVTLTAIHTPGHASDHLCYYLREEKAVFTGDGYVCGVVPQWRLARIRAELKDQKFRSIESMMHVSIDGSATPAAASFSRTCWTWTSTVRV